MIDFLLFVTVFCLGAIGARLVGGFRYLFTVTTLLPLGVVLYFGYAYGAERRIDGSVYIDFAKAFLPWAFGFVGVFVGCLWDMVRPSRA